MGISTDQWMNICGVCGVLLYLGAHGWRIRRQRPVNSLATFNSFFCGLGLFLLLIPLFFRWYLTSGMTLLLSLIMLVGAGVMVLHTRKGSGM